MSAEKKREVIELVRRSPQPKRATIAELGLSRSTFYRWQRRYREQGEAGLVDRKPDPGAVWNRLRPAEKTVIVETALQQPDLSPRELAASYLFSSVWAVRSLAWSKELPNVRIGRRVLFDLRDLDRSSPSPRTSSAIPRVEHAVFWWQSASLYVSGTPRCSRTPNSASIPIMACSTVSTSTTRCCVSAA